MKEFEGRCNDPTRFTESIISEEQYNDTYRKIIFAKSIIIEWHDPKQCKPESCYIRNYSRMFTIDGIDYGVTGWSCTGRPNRRMDLDAIKTSTWPEIQKAMERGYAQRRMPTKIAQKILTEILKVEFVSRKVLEESLRGKCYFAKPANETGDSIYVASDVRLGCSGQCTGCKRYHPPCSLCKKLKETHQSLMNLKTKLDQERESV